MQRPEQPVQIAIVNLLELMGFTYTAPDAGVYVASKRTRQVLKDMGRRAGVADLIVWIPNGTLCIEVKKPKVLEYSFKSHRLIVKNQAGKQTDGQKAFEEKVKAIPGHYYMVAESVAEVSEFIRKNNIKPK